MLYYVIKDEYEIFLLTVYSKEDGERISPKKDIIDMIHKYMFDHSAEETGYSSGWYEFASEDDYREKFDRLGNEEDLFEKKLRETTKLIKDRFDELGELSERDYENEEEFWEARRIIQDEIMNEAYENLEEYIED